MSAHCNGASPSNNRPDILNQRINQLFDFKQGGQGHSDLEGWLRERIGRGPLEILLDLFRDRWWQCVRPAEVVSHGQPALPGDLQSWVSV